MTKFMEANRGEWSELYAAAYLIGQGFVERADYKLRSIPGGRQKIHKVFIRRSSGKGATVEILDSKLGLVKQKSQQDREIDLGLIRRLSGDLLIELQEKSQSGTFTSHAGQAILRELGLEAPAASGSHSQGDLDILMSEPLDGGLNNRLLFSVKSKLGSPATLLNASKRTNITYFINSEAELSQDLVDSLNVQSWAKTANWMTEHYCALELESFDSQTFRNNLSRIDSAMPKHVATLLAAHCLSLQGRLDELSNSCFPLHEEDSEQIHFKLKELVGAVAMGLRPSEKWNGDPGAFRGMLVVKEDGEVAAFYVDNLVEFRDYLFSSLKFERASAPRHGWGQIYYDDNAWKIKLNLQLRFVD